MTGVALIIAFVLAIIVMIVAISKFKVHPFLAIMAVSLILAMMAGIPFVDTVKPDGTKVSGIPTVIGAGFSGTFSSIGIVIILGALIGSVLEKTGAALKLADMVIKVVGKKRPELAIELMGWVVSIPVFCDSGFVILNPIRKALVKRTAVSSVAMTVALSAGLYISHVFIPPTPGPIAAANTLGVGDNLLLVMGLGVVCSIFPLIAGLVYAKFIGKRVKSADEVTDNGEVTKTYEELVAEYGKLPNGFNALAPILVPIILMALGSISSMAGWTGVLDIACQFLGKPIIALAVGTIFGVIQLATAHKMSDFYNITNETLKTAQGSSTVAITTTAGIIAPLLGALGLASPVKTVLCVMAIGAGAMTVSHANDSYFWVVTNFGDMDPEQGYKTQTVCTLIMGIAAMVEIFILSLIL